MEVVSSQSFMAYYNIQNNRFFANIYNLQYVHLQ